MKVYKSFFPKSPNKGDYPSKYSFVLLTRVEDLRSVFDEIKTFIAVDTETTGLNHEIEELVGFSFCANGKSGYYVPLKHYKGNTDHPEEALELLGEILNRTQSYFYNKRFDMRMLESAGLNSSKWKTFDVMVPIWNLDTNIKMPTLKYALNYYLGWDVMTFDEMLSDIDIREKLPEEVCQYASTDALGTFLLMCKSSTMLKKERYIIHLDNKVLSPVKEIEETVIPVDVEWLRPMIAKFMKKSNALLRELHEISGIPFNPDSSQQVADVLVECGCAPSDKTPTGRVSTSAKVLGKVKHPLVKGILEYRSLGALRNAYVEKIIEEAEKLDGGVRVNILPFKVPTGRFATGTDKKNSFFSAINFQSTPKPDKIKYRIEESDEPGNILGYIFVPDPEGEIEGFDQELNIRSAFKPYPGHLWVSIDYKGQELRLPANFSKEPVFVKAFKEGRDIHSDVAVAMLGEPLTAEKRDIAKILNFGLLFGGTAYTIMRAAGVTKEVAEKYIAKYVATHVVLYRWKRAVARLAKKQGFVRTYYGRPRRLRHWTASSNWRDNAFGKRSAWNTIIQGTGSDLMKIGLCKAYDAVYLSDKEATKLYPPVHDELNFSISKETIPETVPKLKELMEIQEKNWEIKMEVEISVGDSWGNIFAFVIEDGKLVPKGKK